MTTLSLLFWIIGSLLLQLAIYLMVIFRRTLTEYENLPQKIEATSAGDAGPPEPLPAGTATWNGFRAFRVARRVIEDTDATICSFYLEPEDGKALAPFLPGQFLTFKFDLAHDTGTEQIIRCYSLSEAPDPAYYRISVKRIPAPGDGLPPGRSSNYLHDQVQEGDVLQVKPPSGHFHIDKGNEPVVLIGGGIGITPMLSMLNWLAYEQPEREVWLFYGVRNGQEMLLKSHLFTLAENKRNFRFHLCFSQPSPAETAAQEFHHAGHININLLKMLLPLKPFDFYICGPSPMMETLVPALEDWGVPESRIHYEAFGPAAVKNRRQKIAAGAQEVNSNDPEIVITFARSGRQVPWQPSASSLLEFAEGNGIAVDSGCRSGSCGTCQTKMSAGEIVYHHAPDFDPEPGTCLLCISAPKTSLTLEV